MSKLIVKTHQQGSFVKIITTIMKKGDDCAILTSDCINVNDMAIIVIKSKGLSERQYCIEQSIQFKKHNDTKNLTVLMDITSDEFEKQFICQDEWVEVTMNTKKFDSCLDLEPHTMLYVTEINITVHAKTPAVSSIWDQIHEETEFTDFKLQGEDGSVPVHKSVLYVHSEMFRAMLREKGKEIEEDSMNMPGVTVQTLKHLKEYMYLGTIPDQGVELLLMVAKRCLIDQLASACIKKLVSTVEEETFECLVEFACQNNIPELMKALVMSILDNVAKEEDFPGTRVKYISFN